MENFDFRRDFLELTTAFRRILTNALHCFVDPPYFIAGPLQLLMRTVIGTP